MYGTTLLKNCAESLRRHRVRFQALSAIALKAFGALAAFVLQFVIARAFGAEGAGLYAAAATTCVLISTAAVFGQDFVVMRNVAAELRVDRTDLAHGFAKISYRIAGIGAVAGTAVTLLLILPAGLVLDNTPLRDILLASVPAIAGLVALRMASYLTRGAGSVIGSQVLEGPFTSGFCLIAVSAIALSGAQLQAWTLGFVYSLATVTAGLVGYLMYRGLTRSWPPASKAEGVGPSLMAGLPILISLFTAYLVDWAATFSMTVYHGSASAGQLRVATQFFAIISLIIVSLDSVLAPRLAAAFKVGDIGNVTRLYKRTIWATLLLSSPVYLGGYIFSDNIMLIFGDDFLPGSSALKTLALLHFCIILCGPAGTVIMMAGKERWVLASAVAGTLVLALLCFWAVPAFGIIGGALAAAGTILIRRLVEWLIVRTRLGVRYPV
jgi:O-antigen/teichoic acid export membrane protein